MKDIREKSKDTQCVHSSLIPDKTGTVVTPIYQTSTFSFRNADHGADLFAGREKGYIYTRLANPTVESVEQSVAILEGGFGGIGCGSGMAALHLAFASILHSGDHVICSESVYGPVVGLLKEQFGNFGISATFVDTTDLNAIKDAIRPETSLIHIETPGNPTMAVSDIAAIADIAHSNDARLTVDNTFMSPILQRPFKHGADIVIHSMTKFINGHADVVAGMVVAKDEESYRHIRRMSNAFGGTIDPFNSFLVARGIKTLSLRVKHQSRSAEKVAGFLDSHPKVDRVMYPGLKSHPQYEIHKRQSDGPGALISFELKGGIKAGKILMDSLHLCVLAVSLGGVETLIQHPAAMTHASMAPEIRKQAGITDGLVRISIGIEDVDEILADLTQGLEKI
ncbi:MAG: aminotransferase class I/II-fold pyridoxal phosphate-dependent enzyme [Candidatus Krumholzibacteriota bacterium]|nr:aminotransferase class I/II-fold pyridoxal phosphate-dependent enzyme [Candidatus Krumholzibacteriota bacterium]